jgi:hypothetical protein
VKKDNWIICQIFVESLNIRANAIFVVIAAAVDDGGDDDDDDV